MRTQSLLIEKITVYTKKNAYGEKYIGGDFEEPQKIEQEKTSEKKKADDISWNSKCAQQKQDRKIQKRCRDFADPDDFLPQIVNKNAETPQHAIALHCAALQCIHRIASISQHALNCFSTTG